MECTRFSEKVIPWLESYLSGRTLKLILTKKFPDPGNLTCDVPQGSIAGPLLFKVNIDQKFLDPGNVTGGVPQESIIDQLLFSLYVNDMPYQTVKCDLFLYADNKCLNFQHEN